MPAGFVDPTSNDAGRGLDDPVGDRITGSTGDRRAIDLVVARNDAGGVSVLRVAAAPGHYQ